jgi:TIR domain
MKNIFISFSGQDSEYVGCLIKDILEIFFAEKIKVTISSNDYTFGVNWRTELYHDLSGCNYGIVCLDKTNLSSAWINFESGALFVKLENKKLCPVFIGDESVDVLNMHPLDRSRICFINNNSDFERLLREVNNIIPDEPLLEKDKFNSVMKDQRIINLKVDLKEYIRSRNDSIGSIISRNGVNLGSASKEHGIISPIPGIKSHAIRAEVVALAKNNLTLVGSSLYNAFDSGNPVTDISKVIERNIESKRDGDYLLNIVLSDPRLYDSYALEGAGEESPWHRIERTLQTLNAIAKKNISKLKLNIYFIPLVQIDHIVLVDDVMIVRPTMLWTNNGEYKGAWLLCEKIYDSPQSEYAVYNAYKKYIDHLMSESICVEKDNFSRHIYQQETKTEADAFHDKWRKIFFEIDKSGEKIKIYKLYRQQLISALHSTWDLKFRNYSPEAHVSDQKEVFINKGSTEFKEVLDFFDHRKYNGEDVQYKLLRHLEKTNIMLNQLIRHYDKKGFAQIYPSIDLGISNNVQRLGGGFATGLFVMWRCGTPIIPIDTTVNACSSSVYKLNIADDKDATHILTKSKLDEIFFLAHKEGYLNSFDSGNHFISVCRGAINNDYYLVLHSSPKEFKYTKLGLYPHKNVWYYDKIRIFDAKDGSGRFIRYLKDDDALHFMKIAGQLPEYNKQIHDWFADKLSTGSIERRVCIKHHYYMPTTYSVAMGVFVEKPGSVVPIFSRPKEPIYLYKTTEKPSWVLKIGGVEKSLIPHGWGQTIIGDMDIENTPDSKILKINNEEYKIEPRLSIDKAKLGVKIREFEYGERRETSFFHKFKHYFSGEIVDVLEQVVCYQQGHLDIF